MTVHAILNNYQMGSYAHQCLSKRIVSETRLDRLHTKVVWKLETNSELNILKAAIGKKIKEGE